MGRFGLVFPGQGAQHPGMGQDLYRGYQGVRELFAEEGNVLGKDRVSLCFTGPQELLDLTTNPYLIMQSYPCHRAGFNLTGGNFHDT